MPEIPEQLPCYVSHLLVAGFHHLYGPIIEFAYPPLPPFSEPDCEQPVSPDTEKENLLRIRLPQQWSELPFLALPDGAHQEDSLLLAFHLPPVPEWEFAQRTTFGSTCYLQIESGELVNKTSDVTRSRVQKAVIILSDVPLYGAAHDKLALATRVYFHQRDFSMIDVLVTFFHDIKELYANDVPDSKLNSGLALNALLLRFKHKVLILFKLMMLSHKVIFFSSNAEWVTTMQYGLLSLFSGGMRSLQSSGDASLDNQIYFSVNSMHGRSTSLDPDSDVPRSTEDLAGLPLHLFPKGCIFYPYMALQQIDTMTAPDVVKFVFGTTNSLFLGTSIVSPDVVVNCDTGSIDIRKADIGHDLVLSIADRKFMAEIAKVVEKPRILKDATPWDYRDSSMEQSELEVRARFEQYLVQFLATLKAQMPDDASSSRDDKALLADFHLPFVKSFQETETGKRWKSQVNPLFNLHFPPGHPCAGASDVRQRIQDKLSKVVGSFMSEDREKERRTDDGLADGPLGRNSMGRKKPSTNDAATPKSRSPRRTSLPPFEDNEELPSDFRRETVIGLRRKSSDPNLSPENNFRRRLSSCLSDSEEPQRPFQSAVDIHSAHARVSQSFANLPQQVSPKASLLLGLGNAPSSNDSDPDDDRPDPKAKRKSRHIVGATLKLDSHLKFRRRASETRLPEISPIDTSTHTGPDDPLGQVDLSSLSDALSSPADPKKMPRLPKLDTKFLTTRRVSADSRQISKNKAAERRPRSAMAFAGGLDPDDSSASCTYTTGSGNNKMANSPPSRLRAPKMPWRLRRESILPEVLNPPPCESKTISPVFNDSMSYHSTSASWKPQGLDVEDD